mmetsp:Transcript_9857/g.13209  ORF Transcript_9857/g.13209 Transcript_9857/m.13209 type:complete len:474 (+) Transcript_9857:195-1616(+)
MAECVLQCTPCTSCRMMDDDRLCWNWRRSTAMICKRTTFFVDIASFFLDCVLIVNLAGKGRVGPASIELFSMLFALTGSCFIKNALGKKRFWLGLLLSELYINLIEDTTTIFLFTNVAGVYDPSVVSNVINVFVKCVSAAIIAIPLFLFSTTFLVISLIGGSRDDVMHGLILAIGSLPVFGLSGFFIYILASVVYTQDDKDGFVIDTMIALYALSVISALSILIGATIFKMNTMSEITTGSSHASKTRSLSVLSKHNSFQDEEFPVSNQEPDIEEANDINLSPSSMDRNSMLSSAEESTPSIDYDYSNTFRDHGSSTVVSSAGGTAGGSTTYSQDAYSGRSFDNNSHNSNSSQSSSPAAVHPTTILQNGFKIKVRNTNNSCITKEISLDIYAPPGKLGIVIDRDDYAIFVHSVKDHSSVIGKLFAGDKLIAIDDECIRFKTVKEVSRMVAERSENPTRKLSIIRNVPETQEEV